MLGEVNARRREGRQLVRDGKARLRMPDTWLESDEPAVRGYQVDFPANHDDGVRRKQSDAASDAPGEELRNRRATRDDIHVGRRKAEQAALRGDVFIDWRLQRESVRRTPAFIAVAIAWRDIRSTRRINDIPDVAPQPVHVQFDIFQAGWRRRIQPNNVGFDEF